MQVLLVSAPLCEPGVPNLAIEALAEIARKGGHGATTLHGALRQPRGFRDDLIHGMGAQSCFTPVYFGLDPVQFASDLTDAVLTDFLHRDRVQHESREAIEDKFFFGIIEAERCISRILADIEPGRYDVIAFSVGFDSQKLPTAALARRLHRRGEEAVIVVGGTGTDEEMGPALLERFPELDIVLQGEVDDAWPMLLDRLALREEVDDVPGCVLRQGETVLAVPEARPTRTFMSTTVPDYSSFIEQRSNSDYVTSKLCLLVETSRGCWWGKKHHCTFCGIRSVDEEYRTRDSAETVALFTELWDRYEPDLLYCTDAIVAADAHSTSWPQLHRARLDGRNWQIFYETKSNMRRREIARMAAAGITRVQPGIESFSTPSLRAMDKGTTAIQQLNYIKWAHAYDVTVNYGIINGMPGETAADLRTMATLAQSLWHLPPPADVNRLALHRFSPHYHDPEGFGLTGVRPFHTQRLTYQCDGDLLRRLVYQLDFVVPEQQNEDYETARDELVNALVCWREAYLAGAGLWISREGAMRIVGRGCDRADFQLEAITDPVEVALLDWCAERASIRRCARSVNEDVGTVRTTAESLQERGLMFIEGDDALTLAVPTDANAVRDAKWELQLIPATSTLGGPPK